MTDSTLFANPATTAPPGVADVQPAEGALRGANGTDGAAAVNGARLRSRSRGACDGDDAGGVDAAANGARRRPGRGGGAGSDLRAEGSGDGSAPDAAIGRARDAAGRAVASLDALLASLRALGGERLEERLGLVGTCENRLAAVKAETVAELARSRGEARAADVLRGGLKQSRHGAKREVKLAGQLAAMPETSGALAEGAITPQHARIIAEAAEQAPIDEAELLAAAEHEPADLFGRTVRDHVNERIGDDLEERRRRQRAQREVSFGRRPDGMYALFGKFDPVAGSRIETALTAAANKLWHSEDPKNRPTPRQRLADALELLVTRTGAGKAQGAAPDVTLLVIADYDTVAGRLRDAHLGDGTPLTPDELVRLACDAKILPALFDRKSQPLWLGRSRRHASAGQRAALTKRDKGCVGCRASANWCQAHHIVHWEHGGPTDIDNMCLLCSHCHHHQVHTNGARIVRNADGRFALKHPQRPPPESRNRTHAGVTINPHQRC